MLCFIQHYVMKMYGILEVKLHVFFTAALYGGERPASRSSYPLIKSSPHSFYKWIYDSAALNTAVARENLSVCPESNPGRLVHLMQEMECKSVLHLRK